MLSLIKAGVIGFKCFLCPSGVDEFPHVIEDDLDKALKILQNTKTVLAVRFLYAMLIFRYFSIDIFLNILIFLSFMLNAI